MQRLIMDLSLSASEEAFKQEISSWLRDNLSDDFKQTTVRLLHDDEQLERRRNWERKLGAGGWLGVSWPRDFGGRGATPMEHVLYLEELFQAGAPDPLNSLGLNLVGPTLIDIGTDEQKHAHLGPMLRGEVVWCQGFSEPNAGSDLAGLQTKADRDGDEWVINGQKIWSSGAQYSDWCALLARTDQDAPKHRGISFLLVDMRSPGIDVRPIKQISGEAHFNEVYFDHVRVPADNIVGEVNGGWLVANRMLAYERGVITMEMIAGHQRQWDDLREFARTTRRGGVLLVEDTRIRERLARGYVDIQLFRLANLRLLTRYMRGHAPGAETSFMKLLWVETEQGLYDLTLSLAGPDGLIAPDAPGAPGGGDWLRYYYSSRAVSIYGGTEDIQRNIIAERVYGLPRG